MTIIKQSNTPICDANVINSEPHGYQVVSLAVAKKLERRVIECEALLQKYMRWNSHKNDRL